MENSEWESNGAFTMMSPGYPPWQNMLPISRLQQLSLEVNHSDGENWRPLQGIHPVFFQTVPVLNSPILNFTSSHKQNEDENGQINQPFVLLREPHDNHKPTSVNIQNNIDDQCQLLPTKLSIPKPDPPLNEKPGEATQSSKEAIQDKKQPLTRKRSSSWPKHTHSNKKKFVDIPDDKTTNGYENLEMDVANILVSDIPIAVVGSNASKDNTVILPKEYSESEFIKQHSSESAADIDSDGSSQSEKENCLNKQGKSGTVEFTCQQCAVTFKSTEALISHTASHAANNFTFTCNVCAQVFRSTTGLQKHVEFNVDDEHQYHCSFCFQPFGNKESLEEHIINAHMSKRPHKCIYCPKAFRDPGSLQKHIRVHTGEKPFQCQACSKSFAEYSSLRKHFRVHTGEQPYKCKFCPKAFSISGNLQRHVLIHTGERPYKCSDCSKAFNNPSHLRRHVKNLHSKLEN